LFDIATGISIPVPDVLKIEDFNKGSPSNWKYTKDNVAPHTYAYKQLGD